MAWLLFRRIDPYFPIRRKERNDPPRTGIRSTIPLIGILSRHEVVPLFGNAHLATKSPKLDICPNYIGQSQSSLPSSLF